MTHTYTAYKRCASEQNTYTTKREELETNIPSKWSGKKPRVAILISEEIHFKKRARNIEPQCHFIILKGRIHQEDWNILHIYTHHKSTQIYNENLGELQERYWQEHNYIGDFNTPLSKMDKSSKQNNNRDIVTLNNALDQMDLTDI